MLIPGNKIIFSEITFCSNRTLYLLARADIGIGNNAQISMAALVKVKFLLKILHDGWFSETILWGGGGGVRT